MTYKLNPAIGKIQSQVVLVFPDGERKKYITGAAACEDVFDRKFVVETIRAVENIVEIKLAEITGLNSSTWIGEEQTSFF